MQPRATRREALLQDRNQVVEELTDRNLLGGAPASFSRVLGRVNGQLGRSIGLYPVLLKTRKESALNASASDLAVWLCRSVFLCRLASSKGTVPRHGLLWAPNYDAHRPVQDLDDVLRIVKGDF